MQFLIEQIVRGYRTGTFGSSEEAKKELIISGMKMNVQFRRGFF